MFIFEKFNTKKNYFLTSSFFNKLVIVDRIIWTFVLSPIITSILSNSELSDDLLDGGDDPMLE